MGTLNLKLIASLLFEAAEASVLPLVGTDIAGRWDGLWDFLVIMSIIFFVLTIGGMIIFAVKYRARTGHKSTYITDNLPLEIIWTIIPTILCFLAFAWGWVIYRDMVTIPSDAIEVRVIGKQWLWQFQYEDGRTTIGDLYVPVHKPVKLVMTSDDVIHSFFVPNFRLKQDVVPGMYTTFWFEASVEGKHIIYCTEYCGTAHSSMLGNVIALSEDDWKLWLRGKKIDMASGADGGSSKPVASLAERGKKLMNSKGCNACHTDDGTPRIGPSYKGLFGSDRELEGGSKVKVDENYLRESIENPQAKIVKGFNPVMPPFKGLLSEEELNALIAYIKSLK